MQCPICKIEFSSEATDAMPFCSLRCRSIDLGRWLDEGYGLSNPPDPEADEVPDNNWSGEQRPTAGEEAR